MGDLPRALSPKYQEDFAYPTLKDRLPVIISKAVDTVYRYKNKIEESYPEDAVEDLKSIVESLSKLRYEMQTNKPLLSLVDDNSDVGVYNKHFDSLVSGNNELPTWYGSSWLYIECYMYRRIQEAISLSTHLKCFDPFQEQKNNSFHNSMDAITLLLENLYNFINNTSQEEKEKIKDQFKLYTAVALWGNQCDLSISGGNDNHQKNNPLKQVNLLQDNLLIDNSEPLYNFMCKTISEKEEIILSIVLDNAGFEFISDLCLVEFLMHFKFVHRVKFYVKAIPWFVSDVTEKDFNWTLDQLVSSDNLYLRELGEKWKENLLVKRYEIKVDNFWTSPHDFSLMKTINPELYLQLSQSDLIIFKGDLNYRKLTLDRKWNMSTSFETALNGFFPSSLVALRTLKADIVVGLSEKCIEKSKNFEKNWMVSGKYGVIQFWEQH